MLNNQKKIQSMLHIIIKKLTIIFSDYLSFLHEKSTIKSYLNNMSAPLTIKSHFQQVGEFHDTFDHPQRKEPYMVLLEQELKLAKFRILLMREELKEFHDAFAKHDLVEMADALCDLSYVTNGAGQCLGIDLDILSAEMGVNISTPDNLGLVDMDACENRIEDINCGAKLIGDALDDFCACVETQNMNKMAESLVKILQHTYALGHSLNFKMDNMFREVHRSNMTKVCSSVEDANTSIEFYMADPERRYENPTIKIKGPYFVIFDAKTSKILKNHKWEMPNLKYFF